MNSVYCRCKTTNTYLTVFPKSTPKGIADKIEDEDKEVLEEAVKEVLDWLDDNQEVSLIRNFYIFNNLRFFSNTPPPLKADGEEYAEKQSELEAIANPIMQKVYAQEGGEDGGSDFEDDEEDDEDFGTIIAKI